MKNTVLIAAAWLLVACGGIAPGGTIKLQFQPAAYRSDGFHTGPTDVANIDGCSVPVELNRFEIRAFGDNITNPAPFNYNVSDIDSDCALSIFLPAGAEVLLLIKAFDDQNKLVRKGSASIPALQAGQTSQFPAPLWPAKRFDDQNGGEGSTSDLRYIEVMRQFDQFLIELAFSSILYPATRGSDDSLRGWMELVNNDNDSSYTLIFDAASEGLTLVNNISQSVSRAEFEFIIGGLQIALPYALLGGADNSNEGIVSAPNVDFAVTLLNSADNVVDVFPEQGRETFK